MNALITAGEINEAHRLARQHAESAVQYAIRCGELLTAKKAELPHGEFGNWVKAHCEFSYSSARAYMQAAAKQTDSALAFSSLREALARGRPEHAQKKVSPIFNNNPDVAVAFLLNAPPRRETRKERQELLQKSVATYAQARGLTIEPESHKAPCAPRTQAVMRLAEAVNDLDAQGIEHDEVRAALVTFIDDDLLENATLPELIERMAEFREDEVLDAIEGGFDVFELIDRNLEDYLADLAASEDYPYLRRLRDLIDELVAA